MFEYNPFLDTCIVKMNFDTATGMLPYGNLTKVTDPLGNETVDEYLGALNRTKTTDALGNVISFEYDNYGNQTKVIDANLEETVYDYDLSGCTCTGIRGLLTYITDADSNVTEFRVAPLRPSLHRSRRRIASVAPAD